MQKSNKFWGVNNSIESIRVWFDNRSEYIPSSNESFRNNHDFTWLRVERQFSLFKLGGPSPLSQSDSLLHITSIRWTTHIAKEKKEQLYEYSNLTKHPKLLESIWGEHLDSRRAALEWTCYISWVQLSGYLQQDDGCSESIWRILGSHSLDLNPLWC